MLRTSSPSTSPAGQPPALGQCSSPLPPLLSLGSLKVDLYTCEDDATRKMLPCPPSLVNLSLVFVQLGLPHLSSRLSPSPWQGPIEATRKICHNSLILIHKFVTLALERAFAQHTRSTLLVTASQISFGRTFATLSLSSLDGNNPTL